MKSTVRIIITVVLLIALGVSFAERSAADTPALATPTDLEEIKGFYTVFYHESENSKAVAQIEVEAESKIKVLDIRELNLQVTGMTLLGWKVYCENNQKWLMETPQGVREWHEVKEEDFSSYNYAFFSSGDEFDENISDGTILHFYAQWKPVIQLENIHVRINRTCDDASTGIGSTIIFSAEVTGCDPAYYILQWQTSTDNENWSDIEGADEAEFSLTVNEQNWLSYIRVVLRVK